VDWYLKHRGTTVHIDPESFPTFSGAELALDIETDEHDNIYCVGICGDLKNVFVWFNPTRAVFEYLKQFKFYTHHWRAEFKWLEPHGFTKEHFVWDTMLCEYVLNAARQGFGLKQLSQEYFGLIWPDYKALTSTKAFIEAACAANPALYQRRVKTTKTRGTKETLKLPRKLTLPQLSKELVANYNSCDVYATWLLKQSQQSKCNQTVYDFLTKIEHPTSAILYEVEKCGILADATKLLQVHRFYRRLMRCYLRAWEHYAGETLPSSPVQVVAFLNSVGVPIASSGEGVLEPFKSHPAVKTLLNYRGVSKICTTYTKPLYKWCKAAPDGRIHANFKQHTSTGRLACAKPNLQNQPKETRGAFIARPGHLFVNADWSQIELRIPAHFSGEPLMVDAFKNETKKIHQVTADALGRSYHIGKTVNFLLTNSGGAYRLAEVAKIPVEEAFTIFRHFHERFNVYYQWTEAEKAAAYANRGVTTLFGRFVPLPEIRSSEKSIRRRAERTAISIKVQGSASDLMKVAMIKIYKKHSLIPVMSLHDELMYEVPQEMAEDARQKVKYEMENVVQLNVPLVAEVGIGKTWKEAKAR